jgi:hypothetical protein
MRLSAQRSKLGSCERTQIADANRKNARPAISGLPMIQRTGPAVKSRSILTLRPPELSGRDPEHLTEVTRQMALVGKPRGIRNLRQREIRVS